MDALGLPDEEPDELAAAEKDRFGARLALGMPDPRLVLAALPPSL